MPSIVKVVTRPAAIPNADMPVQIGTNIAIDAAEFSPPFHIGLALSPISPEEDNLEMFVNVFVTTAYAYVEYVRGCFGECQWSGIAGMQFTVRLKTKNSCQAGTR